MQSERRIQLVYMSASVLPSQAANTVHVMKMSDAFAGHGLGVCLIGLENGARSVSDAELRRLYGVSDDFSIRTVRDGRFLGYRARYVLRTLFEGWVPRDAVIFTRVPKIAALAAVFGRRCVLELHYPPSRGNEVAVRRHLRARSGGTLVVITHTLRDWVVQTLGVPADHVIVAPDGADPIDPYTARAVPPSDRCRVGYLGHLYPGKGMELIEKLAPRLPDVEFLIVGGTTDNVALWRDRMAHVANIRFVGQVPHVETASWLKSFDIALLPNQTHVGVSGGGSTNISRWTSPLKAFEYMAAGLPIVASDQDNLREVLTDNETALLCPPDTVEIWENAIRSLASDQSSRNRLGGAAEREFEAKYSWRRRADFLIKRLKFEEF